MTSNRAKQWFITINKGAECYNNVEGIVLEQTNCTYYLILHDRDRIKQPHYHLVILYQNARTYESIKNKFKGAHIEQADYPVKAIRYLIHKDSPEKEPYIVSEIKTNDLQEHLQEIMNEQMIEPFDPNRITFYYYQDNLHTFVDFYARFGVNVNRYITLIKAVLLELNDLEYSKKAMKELAEAETRSRTNKKLQQRLSDYSEEDIEEDS